MNRLQQKLKENRNRRSRDEFLRTLDERSRVLLSGTQFTSDTQVLRFAAFPTWNMDADCQTTTRGTVPGWQNLQFPTWQSLIEHLQGLSVPSEAEGYFFIDTDGPYYLLTGCAFLSIIGSMDRYAIEHKHYDFGWIGAGNDFGIIVEFDHTSFCRNEFELSIWGM